MGLKNRSFTDEQFIKAINISYSIAETLRRLSLIPAGANYRTFKILSKNLDIDYSHFTGRGHLKGKTHSWGQKKPINKLLIKNSNCNITHLKARLIKENLIKYKCYRENCGISNWHGESISLHLDHINGINNDNRIENFRLLCPNCHSQTPTYCGKNKRKTKLKLKRIIKPKIKKVCLDCGKEISYKASRCKPCAGKNIQKTKIEWPPVNELVNMVNKTSYSEIGRKLGVSDNAVRKHIKNHS